MGSIIEGQGITRELLLGVPNNTQETSSPSVVIGPPTGAHVASFYHSLLQDDLFNMMYMQFLFDNQVGIESVFDDELDDDWDEVY